MTHRTRQRPRPSAARGGARRDGDPTTAPVHVQALLDLQRSAGNRAVSDLVGALPVQRAYVNGSAEKDAPLFEMAAAGNDQPDLANHSVEKKGNLAITSVAMTHFLKRHTYRHQGLSSDYRRYAAHMWPVGTGASDVLGWLKEVLKTMEGRTKKNKMIGVHDVSSGPKVQIGMIEGKGLKQFFPVDGPEYTPQELAAIHGVKTRATS